MTNQRQSYGEYCYPARLAELVKRERPIQPIEMLPKDRKLVFFPQVLEPRLTDSSETGYSFGQLNLHPFEPEKITHFA